MAGDVDPGPAQRARAKAEVSAQRRAAYYRQRIQAAAGNPARQLAEACDYARAVGEHSGAGVQLDLARLIAGLADERNQP